ncbi:MAG: SDR family NAD(P)-dependent oxidoreductase [Deltaproteobacteria bacterium]|nr:SDR family NAD(P)-dependent oxidoreductase [Deltaproteobacteria bacterium]
MSQRFLGKHVVVTGAGRGLGFETARHFLREGANVHLLELEESLLQAAVKQLHDAFPNARVGGTQLNVADKAAVVAAIAKVDAQQAVDVLINNAGIAAETPFLEIAETEWRSIIDVNLTGLFFVAQAVCTHMASRKRGVVVNMASKNGLAGEVGYAHYNSSKAGVIMLTKTMALELAPLGIRVNAVCPGYIQTPMSEAIDSPEFVRDFVDRYIPLGRPGRVEDVSGLFLFLASDDSRFMTGECLLADGGQLAGQKPAAALADRMVASSR